MLRYLQIGEPAFKIAGGVILFMVSWDMLTSKRQARKRRETTTPALASSFAPNLGLNIVMKLVMRPSPAGDQQKRSAATLTSRNMWPYSLWLSRCWPDRRQSCW